MSDDHGQRGIPARMKLLEGEFVKLRDRVRDIADGLKVERGERQENVGHQQAELQAHADRLDTIEQRLGIHEAEAAKAWQRIGWLEKHVEALRLRADRPERRRPPRKR